jgi:lipoprotein NlpD
LENAASSSFWGSTAGGNSSFKFRVLSFELTRNQKLKTTNFATLLWLCFVAGCASQASLPSKPAQGVYHVVKSGENLYRIGKAYDVGYEELARVNGIKNAGQIRVGQRILIPDAIRQLPVEIITPAEPFPALPSESEPVEAPVEGFIWPVSGTVNSNFGRRGVGAHDGIDIGAPEGTPIRAIQKGEVIYSDQLRGYGNIVIVRHPDGFVSVYAHNEANLVREGQTVSRGDIVGRVGSTGRVTGPHLHFEIRKNNSVQDPLRYLPRLCCEPTSDIVAPKS